MIDARLPGDARGHRADPGAQARPAARAGSRSSSLGADDDPATVAVAYEAGANTYIVKPVTFLALVRLMKVFTAYWLETAELPPGQD